MDADSNPRPGETGRIPISPSLKFAMNLVEIAKLYRQSENEGSEVFALRTFAVGKIYWWSEYGWVIRLEHAKHFDSYEGAAQKRATAAADTEFEHERI